MDGFRKTGSVPIITRKTLLHKAMNPGLLKWCDFVGAHVSSEETVICWKLRSGFWFIRDRDSFSTHRCRLCKPPLSQLLTQCCFNVGPPSSTLDQHWNNIGLVPHNTDTHFILYVYGHWSFQQCTKSGMPKTMTYLRQLLHVSWLFSVA